VQQGVADAVIEAGEEAVARSKEAFTVLPSREMSVPWVSCTTVQAQDKKYSWKPRD
jgi:hypothetical protein